MYSHLLSALTVKTVAGAAAVTLASSGAVATVAMVGPKIVTPESASVITASAPVPVQPVALPVAEPTAEPVVEPTAEPTTEPTTDPTPALLTRDEAIAIAQARYPAGTVRGTELEDEDGGAPTWRIRLATDAGDRATIWIDATSGSIVKERFTNAPAPTTRKHHDEGDDSENANESEDHGNASGGTQGENEDGGDN